MAAAFELTRIGIEVNLPQGATYDLLMVSTPEGYPTGQVFFKLEDTPGKITGIQKVAQTFIRMLFTTRGSDVLHPSFGTVLPEITVGANRTNNDAEFRSQIITAVRDAENQAKYILNSPTADAASQLSSVTLQGMDVGKDSLGMIIRLVTKAGETANVAVPFPQLDLPLGQG